MKYKRLTKFKSFDELAEYCGIIRNDGLFCIIDNIKKILLQQNSKNIFNEYIIVKNNMITYDFEKLEQYINEIDNETGEKKILTSDDKAWYLEVLHAYIDSHICKNIEKKYNEERKYWEQQFNVSKRYNRLEILGISFKHSNLKNISMIDLNKQISTLIVD
jgi:hypothetical protein